jgi:hypothetical protein
MRFRKAVVNEGLFPLLFYAGHAARIQLSKARIEAQACYVF